jgi:alpha-galactosidase
MKTRHRIAGTGIKASLCAGLCGATLAAAEPPLFCDLNRGPDAVSVVFEGGETNLLAETKGRWQGAGACVTTRTRRDGLSVELKAPEKPVKHLRLHWNTPASGGSVYLGDAWERAYGELEWKPLDSARVMPWYFLHSDGKLTHGYGVKTGPSALCYWTVDTHGITLNADVRSGGLGVLLGQRTLHICTVVCRQGHEGETPFEAARGFCRQMCAKPRLPKQPVFGFNDWYCSYGNDTADEFLKNTAYVVSLSPRNGRKPFAVVDDGWQVKEDLGGTNGPGLWVRTNPKFSQTLTMPEFAERVRATGARPGIWVRPLIAGPDQPAAWRLARDPHFLDPTVPAVRAYVRQMMARLHGWGFELIKHDYSTFDITGEWGNRGQAELTRDGWTFADRSRTTAEVIKDLYHDIRDGAGNPTLILGCNTIGHLAAGLFELQRIGDDTSGQEWARTRRMGVNCLAFRMAQHNAFFAVDGDCAGQVTADSVPWDKNRQWLELLARSGTALFVSFPFATVRPDQAEALRAALAAAAQPQPPGEPLDWLETRTPSRWLLDGREVDFSW